MRSSAAAAPLRFRQRDTTTTTAISDTPISAQRALDLTAARVARNHPARRSESPAASSTRECAFSPQDTVFLTRSETASLVGARAGLINMLDGLLAPIKQPFAKAVGGMVSGPLDYVVQSAAKSGLADQISTQLSRALGPSLSQSLVPSLVRTMPSELSSRLAVSLSNFLATTLTVKIGDAVTRELSASMTKSVPEHVDIEAPREIAWETGRVLGHALTKSLTHAIVPALTHTLTHTPLMDYFCYYCFHHNEYCSYCSYAPTQIYYSLYYAGYFSTYYADYWSTLFADRSLVRMDQELKKEEKQLAERDKYEVVADS
jgi:hypothetical protein